MELNTDTVTAFEKAVDQQVEKSINITKEDVVLIV
jgi:hypothetical protein